MFRVGKSPKGPALCGFQDSQCARKLLRTRLTAPEYRNFTGVYSRRAFAAMRIVLRSANERE